MAVVIFYGFVFIAVLVVVIVINSYSPAKLHSLSDIAIGLTGVPFGISAVLGSSILLKRSLEKSMSKLSNPTIIDHEFDGLE